MKILNTKTLIALGLAAFALFNPAQTFLMKPGPNDVKKVVQQPVASDPASADSLGGAKDVTPTQDTGSKSIDVSSSSDTNKNQDSLAPKPIFIMPGNDCSDKPGSIIQCKTPHQKVEYECKRVNPDKPVSKANPKKCLKK